MTKPLYETSLPIEIVPTPTDEYRKNRKLKKTVESSYVGPPQNELPTDRPLNESGSRVLLYKQDPSVTEIGIRKVFIASKVNDGPSDARINVAGLQPVAKNSFGDFIQTPGTDAFDSVQAFSVVRMTLTAVQRALSSVGISNPIPWQWNSNDDLTPLKIEPHGLPDTMNAFYSRNDRSLKFGDFVRPGSSPVIRIFTCRSLDIVAHETGHAILDSLKPQWIMSSAPQTGGLHESFGDLTAIFLTLSQLDQAEAVIAQTKANLHDKSFLSDMAEEFGLALGRPTGLRNADNDLRLSEAGTEVHAISQVFTGGIYDILADVFMLERAPGIKDDARTLYDVAQYLFGLLLRAIIESPDSNATYADVVNKMLEICKAEADPSGKKRQYRDFIRQRFTFREVVTTVQGLVAGLIDDVQLVANVKDNPSARGVRTTCCGTMKHDEFQPANAVVSSELLALKQYLQNRNGSNG
jgi:hypothetical protein